MIGPVSRSVMPHARPHPDARKETIVILLTLFVYANGWAGTSAYFVNHRCEDMQQFRCGPDATMAGFGWPVYWLYRFWAEVTK